MLLNDINKIDYKQQKNIIEEQKNTAIKIMDVIGNEIRSTDFSGKQFVIEKGTMKPGIYFVQTIDQKKNVANKKMVIQ